MRVSSRRRIALVSVIAVALAGAAAFGLHTTTTVDVTTVPVTAGPLAQTILTSGTLEPMQSIDVGAQASGRISFIGADYNVIVHAGQVLAQIDPSSYQAQLDIARASLVQAQADEGSAVQTAATDRLTLERTQRLAAADVATQEDLEAAKLTAEESADGVRDARSAISRAQAIVQEAEVNLQHTVITSPIDGIVVSRNVDVGQTLISTMQAPSLFQIAADLKQMQVQVDIDQSDIAGLHPGEPATFAVASYPHATFHGTLLNVRLDPVVATGNVVSYTGIVNVDNSDERLRPGMTAEVELEGLHTTTLRIPNRALEFRPSPDLLKALGETVPAVPHEKANGAGDIAPRLVWEYNGRSFTPVPIRAGFTADGFTELVSGPIHSGDQLVTAALLEHH